MTGAGNSSEEMMLLLRQRAAAIFAMAVERNLLDSVLQEVQNETSVNDAKIQATYRSNPVGLQTHIDNDSVRTGKSLLAPTELPAAEVNQGLDSTRGKVLDILCLAASSGRLEEALAEVAGEGTAGEASHLIIGGVGVTDAKQEHLREDLRKALTDATLTGQLGTIIKDMSAADIVASNVRQDQENRSLEAFLAFNSSSQNTEAKRSTESCFLDQLVQTIQLSCNESEVDVLFDAEEVFDAEVELAMQGYCLGSWQAVHGASEASTVVSGKGAVGCNPQGQAVGVSSAVADDGASDVAAAGAANANADVNAREVPEKLIDPYCIDLKVLHCATPDHLLAQDDTIGITTNGNWFASDCRSNVADMTPDTSTTGNLLSTEPSQEGLWSGTGQKAFDDIFLSEKDIAHGTLGVCASEDFRTDVAYATLEDVRDSQDVQEFQRDLVAQELLGAVISGRTAADSGLPSPPLDSQPQRQKTAWRPLTLPFRKHVTVAEALISLIENCNRRVGWLHSQIDEAERLIQDRESNIQELEGELRMTAGNLQQINVDLEWCAKQLEGANCREAQLDGNRRDVLLDVDNKTH